ncbi:universal stress protein [Hymenobacter busanensis]|uniref:Universal stress protein n=1 Tax=Hymenobacter busanensis TaxID=2607656 RepID=A0A7L4ZRX2_9BACT|nr:universal stress protein [Hymenobacter busanensis]KAA9327686.1 universal stress protein [Hymenobacter busanensis]QHJ05974.1 universal stress protein [Hymenobacter busanensis]
MKTILVPVDLTAAAEHTVVYANKLAVHLGAEVVLLYSHHGPTLTEPEAAAYGKRLAALAERLRYVQLVRQDGRRICYRYAVRAGCLHDHVQSVVEEYAAELLIMNLEHTDCGEPATNGNHAVRIAELASCPVLVVPPGVRQLPSRMAFLANFSGSDFAALRVVGELARSLAAHLQLVHFYHRMELTTLISTKKNMRLIQEHLPDVRSDARLLRDDDALEAIGEFCAQQRTQLLVFAPTDAAALRRFFDVSYTKTQAYHTRIPVLVLRPTECSAAATCCEQCARQEELRPVAALPDYRSIRWA